MRTNFGFKLFNMRKSILSIAFLILACLSLHAQELEWKRDVMDGSRTGCIVPLTTDYAMSIGSVKGHTYYAPSGKIYKSKNISRTASVVLAAQNALLQVKEPVGTSAKELRKYYPESPLSNFFIDTIMKETERISGKKVDLGIGNFGGIRVDMPSGTVIVDDIMSMFPFKNYITYLTIKGSDVRRILERMAMRGFQVLGGVEVLVEGGRLLSAEIGGAPIDDEKLYGLATISFLLDGGDNLSLRSLAHDLEVYPDLVYDVIMDHILTETKAGRMLDADEDGRVKILDYEEEKEVIDYGEQGSTKLDSKKKLVILHTNDTHSHIDPVRGGLADGLGGVIERSVYVDSVRQAVGKRNLLMVDAGDFSQGTSYFSIHKGDVEIEVMNAIGYDVVALGNHEFDNGVEELARRLAKARFEVVCANYDFTGTPLEGLVKPYTIVRKAGNKIGIIGLLTDVTKVVDRSIADKMTYQDPVETANRYAKYLKETEKCDIVLCLSHLGFDGRMSDSKVASMSEDIDLIIGGHSHTELQQLAYRTNVRGEKVVVVQDGSWGTSVGNLRVN